MNNNPCKHCKNYGKASPCDCILGGWHPSHFGDGHTSTRRNGDVDLFDEKCATVIIANTTPTSNY